MRGMLGSVAYVVIRRNFGASPCIQQMFWSGDESDFENGQFKIAWRHCGISVDASADTLATLTAYGQVVELAEGTDTVFFAVFDTSLGAENYLYAYHPEFVRERYAVWNRPCPFDVSN